MNPENHRRFLTTLLQHIERIGEDLALKAQWVRDLPNTVPQERRDALQRLLHNHPEAEVERGTRLAECAQRARIEDHFLERTPGYEHACRLDGGIIIATVRVAHPAGQWLQVVVNPPQRSGDCSICPPVLWVSTDIDPGLIEAEAGRVAYWVASQILAVEEE